MCHVGTFLDFSTMIIKTVTQVGRYCAPRSRSSKWCLYLILSLFLMCVVSYKSGFLHYFIVAHVLQRKHYSLQELSDMIPNETKLKVSECKDHQLITSLFLVIGIAGFKVRRRTKGEFHL